MQRDTTYCYKGSTEFVIENGILKGAEETYLTEHISLGECILHHLKATPKFIGQIDGITGKEESFGHMMKKSVKCAMWLKEQNVQLGDIVGACIHNQLDMYVPYFASLYIGAVFNPWWDAGITNEMASHFLTLTCPKIVFAHEASAELILELTKEMDMPLKIIVLGNTSGFQSLDEIVASQDPKNVDEFQCTQLTSREDPALILYTSGSSGLPKGVLYSHKSQFGIIHNYNALGIAGGNTIPLIYAPLAWATGNLSLLRATISHETRIIQPQFSEETIFQLIQKFKVNWIFMGTSDIVRLQKSAAKTKYDLSSLKYLYVAGSVLKESIYEALAVDFPHSNICQSYGLSEVGGITRQHSQHHKTGSSGTILKNIQVKVIDTDSGVVLGPNQKGEVCFKSDFMMTCYYKNPKATNEAIDAQGWLHTGDLGHYDEEGVFYITDRIKDMIKYRGEHVSPPMIEQVLQAHPAVFEVGVVGIPSDLDDEHAIAFVAKKPNAQVTKEELLKLVTEKLPDYMHLHGGLYFLQELPHTSSGKISKPHLRKIAQTGKIS